jgi:beta-lactamase regulating signal transducer with metallopeptidase domain
MTLLLESTIKISLLLGLALTATALLRHRSAALRHWVLAAAIASSMAIPALMTVAPSWSLPVTSRPQSGRVEVRPDRPEVRTTVAIDQTTPAVDIESNRSTETSAVAGLGWLLQPVWLAGVVMNLGALLVGLWRLARVSLRARLVTDGPWAAAARRVADLHGLGRPVRLLQSDHPALLVTWGIVTPRVMLPADAGSWAEDRIYVVLAHELAHVRRGDWLVQLAGELLRIVYWFNPIMWLACSRVRQESEHACDDAVVNLGVQGRDYAVHLLELARAFGAARHTPFPAPAIAPRPSSLQRRVSAMLNAHINRRPVTRLARTMTTAVLLGIALPIALFAQNTFATVSGVIVDPSSALLPGVKVVAIDSQRGARHEVLTSRSGQFELLGLPQGSYLLEAALPGFETFQQKLALDGQDMHHDITMSVGSLQETIAVTKDPNNFFWIPGERYKPRPANCGPSGGGGGDTKIGGQIRQPRKLHHVPPVYPSGTTAPSIVKLEAIIGTNGLVKEVKLANDAAPAFARSAIDAVRQWEFDPTLLNCAPIEVRMSVLVDFR